MGAGVTTRKMCRHCGKRPVNRPRGLCWTCFYAPGVKDLYPVGTVYPGAEKYARRGLPNFCRDAPPPEPTRALPGSAEKLAVLAERARLGQSLHHPADPYFVPVPEWAPPICRCHRARTRKAWEHQRAEDTTALDGDTFYDPEA